MSKKYKISHPTGVLKGQIQVPGSKSESNRLLVLKELFFPNLQLKGLSSSNDTQTMLRLLSDNFTIEKNVGDAGTVMRFLTALCSVKEGEFILKGTARMHERPIGVLVDALQQLGADIEYLGKIGYPPLKISGKKLEGGSIELDGSISSQFISALMMIAPSMSRGLEIYMKGELVSKPYVQLTVQLMQNLGLEVEVLGSEIKILSKNTFSPSEAIETVEPDWSSASYWYAICALSKSFEVDLNDYKKNSLQGDAFISKIFETLGVETSFTENGISLKKKDHNVEIYTINLVENPDLAQTLSVVLAAFGIRSKIRGLQTLKIKETDRLHALKVELEKVGAKVEIGEDYLEILEGIKSIKDVEFDTWKDHRMAMALAPLALIEPVIINDPMVISKSYPSFWDDLKSVGFEILEQ